MDELRTRAEHRGRMHVSRLEAGRGVEKEKEAVQTQAEPRAIGEAEGMAVAAEVLGLGEVSSSTPCPVLTYSLLFHVRC
eukprot:2929650-Rhodomonas_salina.1